MWFIDHAETRIYESRTCPAFFPRLILQYNKDAMAMFNKDPKGNLARADVNWKKLVEQDGK